VVSGGRVPVDSRAFVLSEIGTVDALARPVSITDNGTQAVIVTGVNGYLVDLPPTR
jgi:hypothetical protein